MNVRSTFQRKRPSSSFMLWNLGFTLMTALWGCTGDKPLVAQGSLGEFTLKNQQDQPVTRETLKDKVWIADFIFTSCPTICPKLTQQMRWLQAQLAERETQPLFLSFSVDPERDTPPVLAKYVKDQKVDDRNWLFLTGEIESVKKLVVEDLKLAMGEDPKDPENILHGSHFILGRGEVLYGYYRSDKRGLKRLVQDATSELKRPRSP